eukprot:2774431-Rhodomonas_salina.1
MAAHQRHWKDHPLKHFILKDGILPGPQEWRTWLLPTSDKFDVMLLPWFIKTAESLVFVDEEFQQIVAHPALD